MFPSCDFLKRRKPFSLSNELAEPARYRRQLERLLSKHLAAGRIHLIQQEGVSLAGMAMDAGNFSKAMAKAIGRSEYSLKPARARVIAVNGKEREVFAFELTDLLLHGVVAELTLEIFERQCSPFLYSYRRGKNWWHGVSALAEYARAHRRKIADPSERGLYIMRRDIRKYTDTIPVGAASPLWPQLRTLFELGNLSSSREQSAWNLASRVIRPEIIPVDGQGLATKYLGVPTGSPISTTLFNVYLDPVDQLFSDPGEGFYARYADDIIFAHPDPSVVQQATRRLDLALSELGLSANQEKGRDLYFNGAGRRSPDGRWRGTQAVGFLGCAIKFDATVSLGQAKVRNLFSDLKSRICGAFDAYHLSGLNERVSLAVTLANQALDPGASRPHKTASLLSRAVTDRDQLREIDDRVALLIATLASGIAGPRAFRKIPYRALRREHHLVSVHHQRNIGK